MKLKISDNRGISILEVMVAILIIAIGMVGVLSLVIQNIQAQYVNKNILIASGLAQEGLELVRNTRDLNWLTPGNDWKQDIVGDGTYIIDYNGRSSINMAIPENTCGNGDCEPIFGEMAETCSQDCYGCGDGVCNQASEDSGNCSADCASTCKNGVCDSGETSTTCPADCPPPPNNFNDAGTRLYVDSYGFYTTRSSGNAPTNFYRLITAVGQANYLDVKCTIRWKEGAQNRDYTAETYLYNWR